MATNSNIEWTNHTCNLWQGCTRVHAGCDNCYAARLSARWGNKLWDKLEDGTSAPRLYIKAGWNSLRKWQKEAAEAGEYRKVFVGSMMDIFEKPMPVIDSKGNPMVHIWDEVKDEVPMLTKHLRDDFFNRVVPSHPNLIFLLLTKRPSNINKQIPAAWLTDPPRNVMFGASVVDQKSANDVARHFSKVKGAKFISVEPLLEAVTLEPFMEHYQNNEDRFEPPVEEWNMNVDWVIVGGESGPKRRPFDPDWARSIKNDCEATGTAFFMKQWDKVKEVPDDIMIREFPQWFNFK